MNPAYRPRAKMQYPDFEEFIAELNAHGVKYLILGAHALAHHARPRATKDLDVLIELTIENASKVLAAIKSFLAGPNLATRLKISPIQSGFCSLG